MTILKVEQLSYFYNNERGISNISFDLNKGDIVALVGKNGAGKSTLINTIIGLQKKQSGEIYLDDSIQIKDIQFSTQKQMIDWYLNVKDNILMNNYIKGLTKESVYKNYADILKIFDLGGLEYQSVNELSGGQLQRVQISRALVTEAKLIILDEPTTGIDQKLTINIMEYIEMLAKKGIGFLLSSHDLDVLEKYCNKIIFLEEGHQTYFGDMKEFVSNYVAYDTFNIYYKGRLTHTLIKKLEDVIVSYDESTITITLSGNVTMNELLIDMIEEALEIQHIEKDVPTLKKIFLGDIL